MARYNNGSSGPINAVHAIDSNCVTAGFAPEITGIRDDATGLEDEIERGSAGPYLQIYGNNVQGTFVPTGSSVSPNTGISQWATTGVYPASGQVNLSYSVQASAPTGQRSVTLTNAIGPSPPWSLWVTDPSPQILSVTPDRPWEPGETVTVQVNGKGFGSDPTVTVRATDTDTAACLGSDSVSIIGPVVGTARDTQIVFTKSVPENSVSCNFQIVVTSRGLSGSFAQGNNSTPKSQQSFYDLFVGQSRPPKLIVYIVHGLSDSSASFTNLRNSLVSVLPPNREVDARFNFPECESISMGAQRLKQHVKNRTFRPGDRLAFIGHSMGGLIIREMLAKHYPVFESDPPVVGLVTLGTPHLGYPYKPIDGLAKCSIQTQEMASYLNTDTPGVTLQPTMLSPFLRDLRSAWSISQVSGNWLAVSGRSCSNPIRNMGTPENGCRANSMPFSDSVVCADSAGLLFPGAGMTPTSTYTDMLGQYQHAVDVGFSSTLNVLCGNTNPRKQTLTDPVVGSPLFNQIRDFLNAL